MKEKDREIPLGLCQCGCGGVPELATYTNPKRRHVKGQPLEFIRGHQFVISPQEYKVDPKTGCWLWLRSLNNKGYGRVNKYGYNYAHIMYYEKAKGKIPKGFEVDHLCKTTACVNPEHMEAVTHKENMRRNSNTKLTEELVDEIRQMNKVGIGYRRLAKIYGVHRSTIQSAVLGANW